MFRVIASLVGLLGGIAPLAAAEKPPAPGFVIRVPSLKALREDANWVDRLTRGAEEAKKYDDKITEDFGKDHAGMDVDRPAGIYGYVKDNGFPDFVLIVPLNNPKRFVEQMGKWFGAATEDKDDKGLYHMPGRWFSPQCFRIHGKHAYLTWMEKDILAKGKLLDPDKVLASDLPATISAIIYLERVPDAVKRVGLDELNRMVDRVPTRMPGESQIQHQLRTKVTASATQWLNNAAKEGDRVEFQMGVDRKADEFFMQLDVRARSGTKLAGAIEKLGQSQSRFAGRPRDGECFGLQLRWDLPEDLKPVVRPVVDEAIRRAMQHAADDTVREHATKLTKALAPTLEPGELDAAFSLLGPAPGTKHYTLLAAFKAREGKVLDEAIRGLVKSLPERERDKFRFDIATVSRTGIHRADVQYDFEDLIAPLFGKHPAYFAVTDDGIWVTLGPDGQAVLKKAIAAPAGAAPLLSYEISFARTLPLAASGDNSPTLQKTAERILKKGDGSDKFRFTLEGGKSLRGRFAVKSGALEMIREIDPNQSWPLGWLFR